MGGGTPVDLVVVGAGAAGLAAAKTARERGLGVVLLEAGDRIGGRARTDHATFGFPWDRGCHWLHSASVNPLRDVADALGVRYQREPTPWRFRLDGRWATDAEQREQEAGYDRAHEAAAAAGAAGQDVPLASVVDLAGPGGDLYRAAIHAEWGVAPADVSTRDLVAYRDTDEDWPVEDGYGVLIARLHADVPVAVRTPAERIDWSGPGVRVTTPRGVIEAIAVVVTVSTDALAADLIRFEPALPDWKREAATAVPLGRANKVAFAIDGRRLGVAEPTNVVVPVAGRGPMSFRLRPFGRDLADGYLAGPLCKELEEIGEEAMIEAALAALRDALGADATRHVAATACTRWGAEPWILGAYAAARPGQGHRRADLARPLADRVFFAGEATSPDFFSTCHGAHLTGIAAAHAVAAALAGRAHGPRTFSTAAHA